MIARFFAYVWRTPWLLAMVLAVVVVAIVLWIWGRVQKSMEDQEQRQQEGDAAK